MKISNTCFHIVAIVQQVHCFISKKRPLNFLRGEKNRLNDFQILSGVIADLKRTADLPRKMKEIESWLNGG